jgi:hypothetical protein
MLTMANFATVGLGDGLLGGKFSLSNLGPVLFIMFAGPCFLVDVKSVHKRVVGLLLFFNVCAFASFALFMFRFGWVPNLPVLFFQNTEILFALLLIWYARRNYEEFFAVAKLGIIVSVALSIAYGIHEFGSNTMGIMSFSMDDKSQAGVLFCCQAYILLRYFNGFVARVVAAVLLVMSMMTLSRLPAVFLPLFLVTLVLRSRYGALLAATVIAGIVVAFVTFGDALTQLFKVVDRLNSVGQVAGDNATSAHLLLIKSALQIKFSDFWAFLFGTGPGNFSKALTSFPIDIRELESLDPALVADARVGRAPMHSTPISLLLDYNLVLFGLLVYLALRAVRFLLRTGHYLDLFFFATLFGASTFYSLHNKPYFFLAITTVTIGVLGRVEEEAGEHSLLPHPAQGPLAAGEVVGGS